jgi:hypothetical protein
MGGQGADAGKHKVWKSGTVTLLTAKGPSETLNLDQRHLLPN